MFYIKNNQIYKVENTGTYTDQIFVKKGEPKKTRTWIKYKVSEKLGTKLSDYTGFHIQKENQKNVVFETLESAKNYILEKLENRKNEIENLNITIE